MYDEKILPVEEMVAYEEFTDRVEILRELDGKFFGKSGQIRVPLFQFADTKYVKGVRTPQYQTDVYGKEKGKEQVWICECKYTKASMGISQVKKLEQAAEALRQEAEDAGLPAPGIQMWLVSTGGFTREVLFIYMLLQQSCQASCFLASTVTVRSWPVI